jgi:hypothetical protein
MRREVLNMLKVPVEAEDPPVILNTMYHGWKMDANPPFYISSGVNSLCLNNCMLDSGASKNAFSLNVMKQLGLKKTHPYGNVYGIDSKKVKFYGLIEDMEVYLEYFPDIGILMNIVVIDVIDACDPGGYRGPPTFFKWLKTIFWPFWQFTIFSRFSLLGPF